MLKRYIGLIVLFTCSFAAHAAFLTVHNHTESSLSYASGLCYPIKPFSEEKVPVRHEGHFYTNSHCNGPIVASLNLNEKYGIESIRVYGKNMTFQANRFDLVITQLQAST
ncbi:MAG: hypothetical protein H0W64_02270 [Gammaproteobacteria bacterium]|nr:hypothetical protein [Gammaproteobacteria bacterium]